VAATPYDEQRTSGSGPATREQLERDIELTRDQLGETVEALSNRLDVKARVKARALETSSRTAAVVRANRSAVVGLGAAVLGSALGLAVWRRRR
jgi:hypothetical protein